VHSFLADLRYGTRVLLKAPAFTAVAVTALALGIGANLTIFGFAWPLLVSPPRGIANPASVVRVFTNRFSGTALPRYEAYRDRTHTLTALAAFRADLANLRMDGPAEQVVAMAVTGNYFSALGVGAAIGRPIVEADDRPGSPPVVVLGDRFWRVRFNASPSVIGQTMTINGARSAIVGVAPAAFAGTMTPIAPAFYVQLGPRSGEDASVQMIGRLRPGAAIGAAQADLTTIAIQEAGPRTDGTPPPMVTVYQARALVPELALPAGIFAGFLLTLVGLVLMVACANIATLLLARSAARRREIGIRVAIGATRGRLVRQMLAESLLLSTVGGAMAAVAALAASRPLASAATALPSPVPLALDFAADWRLLLAVAALSLVTTMVCGLMPALQASRRDVLPALKDGVATPGPERSRVRALFMTAQVAMATILLVLAGLLVRGMLSARTLDRGFAGDGVLVAGINLESAGYGRERGAALYEALRDRLESTPGIAAATIADIVPLTLSNRAGPMVPETSSPPATVYNSRVSRGHFRTLGIPLLAGRDFSPADSAEAPPVAIVNEFLANRFWPGENPIGKHLRSWDGRQPTGASIEVVGLVRNSKYVTVGEEPRAFMYRPMSQEYVSTANVIVKTAGSRGSGRVDESALALLRAQVESLDPNLPLFGVMTLDAATSVSILPVRIAASLAAALGLVALALGGIGLYGVMTYLVRQRTREIGIRIALGADRTAVIRLIAADGLRWTLAGLTCGIAVSSGIALLIAGFLYGVRPADPIVFASVAVVLTTTAWAACYLPARRASRVDPIDALRDQ